MAENINVGTMVTGGMSNNNIIEKHCYDNLEANCDIYGGLYLWDEMMQYSTLESTQGFCPEGFHLPSDDDWKALEIELGMTSTQASGYGFRGTDQGSQLAGNEMLWIDGDLDQNSSFGSSGFDILPAGFRDNQNNYFSLTAYGYFYTSSNNNVYRSVTSNNSKVNRLVSFTLRTSVRCLQD